MDYRTTEAEAITRKRINDLADGWQKENGGDTLSVVQLEDGKIMATEALQPPKPMETKYQSA
jgi:hypothetical protein